MPIRFICTNCRQALAIAARKAGSKIKCPKCQAELTVPVVADPADAPIPPAFSQQSSAKQPNFAEFVFDDVPAAVDTPPMHTSIPLIDVRTDQAPGANVVIDRSLVAISRTVLYAQAVLIVVVALAAFGIGYFTGRGERPPTTEELSAIQQPVAIEGDVVFRNHAGADAPDAGAVVIAVPHGAEPGQKFPIAGLRPSDAAAQDGGVNVAVQALESEGGGYARADDRGHFTITVRPGNYWVLVISASAARPNGVLPTTSDEQTLGRYFNSATDLLADRRYMLTEQQLSSDASLKFALEAK
jgi:hypothetical protein